MKAHSKSESEAARLSRWLLALAVAGLFAGCSASTPGMETSDPTPTPPTPTPTFELALSSTKVPVLTGGRATADIVVTRADGFAGEVALALEGLPAGVTATLEPPTVAPDQTHATLTLQAAEDAPHSLPTAAAIRGSAGSAAATTPLTVTVHGPPGSLDTSFAAAGKPIIPVGAGDDYAYAMATQPDGKILLAGRAAEHAGDFAIVRLDRDGNLDASFGPEGSPGKVLTDFGGGADTARAVGVQPDGKIVVAGSAGEPAGGLDFGLARYLPDGTLDAAFGTGGKVTTALGADSDNAFALLIAPDGHIVLGGESNQGASGTGVDFALARYDATGALDAGFGDGGKVVASVKANSARDSIYALAFQDVGGEARIVAAGGEGDFAAARFRPDGALDATFGASGNGKVTALMGSSIGAARAVRVTSDGKLLLAGHANHDFALVRLGTDGRLDAGFGAAATPGRVITPVQTSWDEAQSLALDGDGRIVVAGWAYEASSTAGNFAVLRYLADGQLDATFGASGVVITPVAAPTRSDQATAVLLQADERVPTTRVLVAGYAAGSANYDFAVTRYWP